MNRHTNVARTHTDDSAKRNSAHRNPSRQTHTHSKTTLQMQKVYKFGA